MRPEALDEQQIELLIHEQVHQKLQVILEGEMALALQDFVDKVSAADATLVRRLPLACFPSRDSLLTLPECDDRKF